MLVGMDAKSDSERSPDTEIGLLSLGDLLPDPNTGDIRTESERHRTLVDQAILAEQIGMHSIHLGEHHGSSYQLSSPAVVLAAIGERTERLRLSTGVTLVANLDPFRVAEDYATLDVLSRGRAEIVAGRGSIFARTFEIFGQDPAQSRALFTDHVELLLKLLRNEKVHADGLRPLHGETSRPRPYGELPVWIGGGTSNKSIDLAARLGCPLMLPSVFAPPAAFAPIAQRYREQWQLAGHESEPVVGACCHVHVAPESQLARSRFQVWFRNYWEWVQQLVNSYTPDAASFPFDYQTLINGPAIVGSPAEVVDRIGTTIELLGLDRMIFMFDLGGIPDDVLFPTLELFGAEVMPALART
jgi:alkanesulfonate monooxygenase SsuD/methylene tetrahydromethanopterin reductase-like flavin-dependent oxidoreductase (luciferase family)